MVWPDFDVPLLVEILYADFLVNNFLVITTAHTKTADHHKKENEVCERRNKLVKCKSSNFVFSIR